MLAELLLSTESTTWVLTCCVVLLAYVLGAMQYRPGHRATEASGAGTSSGELEDVELTRVSGERGHAARLLAAVKTDKMSMDAERAPQTPAKRLVALTGGQGEESGEEESRSEDGEGTGDVEDQQGEQTKEDPNAHTMQASTGANATAGSARGLGDPTGEVWGVVKAVRRKVRARQVYECAVVQYRDGREHREVRASGGVEDGADGYGRQASHVSNSDGWLKKGERKGQRKGETKTGGGERKVGGGASRAGEVPVAVSQPGMRMRTTPEGIPVVDVPRKGGVVTEKMKGSSGKLNAMNTVNKSPSRTSSNVSERERASVLYRSPSSPLSPKASDYAPQGQRKHGGVAVTGGPDRGAYVSVGVQGGFGGRAESGKQQRQQRQRQLCSRVGTPLQVGLMDAANTAFVGEAPQGASMNTIHPMDVSPISTISNKSPAASPMHRRDESENTKLEGAWMTASMAAAELGLELSNRASDGLRDTLRGVADDRSGNVQHRTSAWQSPWGQSVATVDSLSSGTEMSHVSNLSSLSKQVSHSLSDTDQSSQDPANYGLDLYSSLSSLSWANSNSLSSFGSSLHRTTSAADRPDVFDTIKGIWGEQGEEEKIESALID